MSAAAPGLKSVGVTLKRALAWWCDALEASLPGWVVTLFAGDRRCVRIVEDEPGVMRAQLFASPWAARPEAETDIVGQQLGSSAQGRRLAAAARTLPVILQAPPSKILTQTVRMPAAALENLDEAARYGLSTWTPFSADDVVFHAGVVEKSDDHARIRIQMMSRVALDPLVEAASRVGLNVSAVAFGPDLVSFGEAGEIDARRRTRSARIDLALAASAALIGIGLVVALHVGWSRELDDLAASIRTEVARRAAQTRLETELKLLETRERSVIAKRAEAPPVSAVIADLADRLPDGADVQEFEWSGRQGRVRLKAPDGVELESALDASSVLASRRERAGRGGAETYQLTLRATR